VVAAHAGVPPPPPRLTAYVPAPAARAPQIFVAMVIYFLMIAVLAQFTRQKVRAARPSLRG
jgi:hypothetical protein